MAILRFNAVEFDAALVILDKDGTMVDFDHMWGQFALEWAAELAGPLGLPQLESSLLDILGYDSQRKSTRPGTPLVSGSAEQLQSIAATILVQAGIPWSEAVEMTRRTFARVALHSPPGERIRSFGDLGALLAGLQSAGVRVAVVTTDDRRPTSLVLEKLGVSEYVDTMVCGDDGIAWKPAADMLVAACTRLEIAPVRAVVVGDTVADMVMAERGGAGLKVAVLSGVGDERLLRQAADVVLSSIADVVIVD
jgi:phosphoglycolate phosphatase